MTTINESILSANDPVGGGIIDPADLPGTSQFTDTPNLSPIVNSIVSLLNSTDTPELTDYADTPNVTPNGGETSRLDSTDISPSSALYSSDFSTLQSEITPRRLDADESFRVTDNPTFQPTAIGSPTQSVTSTHSISRSQTSFLST